MKQTELDLVILVLSYSAWLLGGCFLMVGLFVIIKYKVRIETQKVKELFFKEKDRPNGKPKITNGKF